MQENVLPNLRAYLMKLLFSITQIMECYLFCGLGKKTNLLLIAGLKGRKNNPEIH